MRRTGRLGRAERGMSRSLHTSFLRHTAHMWAGWASVGQPPSPAGCPAPRAAPRRTAAPVGSGYAHRVANVKHTSQTTAVREVAPVTEVCVSHLCQAVQLGLIRVSWGPQLLQVCPNRLHASADPLVSSHPGVTKDTHLPLELRFDWARGRRQLQLEADASGSLVCKCNRVSSQRGNACHLWKECCCRAPGFIA